MGDVTNDLIKGGASTFTLTRETLSAMTAWAFLYDLRRSLEAIAHPPPTSAFTGVLVGLLQKAVADFGGQELALRVLSIEADAAPARCRELHQREAA